MLQKVVALLEETNFYAISYGCGGKGIACPCGEALYISVETKEKVHEIKDHGICSSFPFGKYCDLWSQINTIVGEFQ